MRGVVVRGPAQRVDHVLRRPDVGIAAAQVDDLVPLLRPPRATRARSRAKYCSGRRSMRSGLGARADASGGGLHFPAGPADDGKAPRSAAACPTSPATTTSAARGGARHERRPPARGRNRRHPPLRDGDAAGRDLRLQHVHRRRPREPARAAPGRPDARGGLGGRRPPGRPGGLRHRRTRRSSAASPARSSTGSSATTGARAGSGTACTRGEPRTAACSSTGSSSTSPTASRRPRRSPTRSASSSTSPTTTR